MKQTIALIFILIASVEAETIRIATKPTPPFALKNGDEWGGFTFDIFRRIKPDADLEIFEYTSNDEIFTAVNNGTADVGLAAPTKTKEREEIVDFTYAFYNSGFKIMVKSDAGESAVSVFFNSFFNSGFMFSLLLLILFVVTIATLAWISEAWLARRSNPAHEPFFNQEWKSGIAEGAQWVFLNLLKKETNNPRHWTSRILTVIVMMAGMVFFASFTGYISAQMVNAQQSSSTINSIEDIKGERVGTVLGTTSHDYLVLEGGIIVVTYSTIEEMFDSFHAGDTFAVVYDFPILLYHVKLREEEGLFDTTVVGETFSEQTYGMVVNDESLKEDLNQGILDVIHTESYYQLIASYFEITTVPNTDIEISAGWWVGMVILGIVLIVGIYFAVINVSKRIVPKEDFLDTTEKALGKKVKLTNEALFNMMITNLAFNDYVADQIYHGANRHTTFASDTMSAKDYAKDQEKRRNMIKKYLEKVQAPSQRQL